MLWITLLLALLIALAALGYMIWPLVSPEIPLLPVEDSRLSDLLVRKDTALRSIKDLEFDHQVGKIADEDYQRLRDRLNRQAIGLIQQLERLTPESATVDALLEEEIAKLRRVQAKNRVEESPAVEQDGAWQNASATAEEVAVAEENRGKQPAAVVSDETRFCTECGVKVDFSFKFCANCGAPVAQLNVAEAD